MTHPRSIAAFTATWLLLTLVVAVWCCALRGEDEVEPTPEPCPICGGEKVLIDEATGKEEPCMECAGTGYRPLYGRIFDGHRWRNRPKPIQKITTNIKDTSANGATIAKWATIGAGLLCVGVLLLPIIAMLCRGPRLVVVRPEERKP